MEPPRRTQSIVTRGSLTKTVTGLLGMPILRAPLQPYRIAEFVRLIAARMQGFTGTAEGGVVGEGAQELVVTGGGLVGAGEDDIDDAEPGCGAYAIGRQALAGAHLAVAPRSMFEGADDGGADGDNAAAPASRARQCAGRYGRNAVGLVQGQPA